MTPGEFLALLDRHQQIIEREFFPTACLMSMYVNAHRDPKRSRAVSPEDFMPRKSQAVKKVSVAEFAKMVKEGAFGA